MQATNDIAIIGMSAMLPGASTMTELEQNLRLGVDSVREIPDERRRAASIPAKDYNVAGYLDRVDLFDHHYFKISLRDAERMDPQQRLLLELAVATFEDAGYSPSAMRGSNTAVLVGAGASGYGDFQSDNDPSVVAGNLLGPLAGRIAYLLDLHGPAMVLETSCSSALVAMHEACNKLTLGEIDYALVGGVSVLIYLMDKSGGTGRMGVLSPDGRSKTFDASANGTGVGEGGALVLLKRRHEAERDGDTIRALIKGSAINQDGGRSNGLTAPSPAAQAEVICRAWARADVDPRTIGFIEAHGTGTKLGDPIEIDGLNRAFASHTDATNVCAVSAIKSNLGHLGYAAGVASLLKVVLALEHGVLYPSLHYHTPNPLIPFAGGAVYVNTETAPWPRGSEPRRSGLSSFGVSGTNAHMVLEQAPASPIPTPITDEHTPHLVTLSGKTPAALARLAAHLAEFLAKGEHRLADVAHTLNRGRDDHRFRQAWVVSTIGELTERLRSVTEDSVATAVPANTLVVFLASDKEQAAPRAPLSLVDGLSDKLAGMAVAGAGEGDAALAARVAAFQQQYSLYELLTGLGVTMHKLIGAGAGNAVVATALGKCTIEQGLARAAAYVPRAGGFNHAGLDNAVATWRSEGTPLFVELGQPGELSEALDARHGALPRVAAYQSADAKGLLAALAALYCHGGAIDWDVHYRGHAVRRVPLPTYPFERTRCWITPPLPAMASAAHDGEAPGTAPARPAPAAKTAAAQAAPRPQGFATTVVEVDATETEKRLAQMWGAILKVERVSRSSDYIEEGGDSLNGAQLAERIQAEFAVDVDPADVFDYATLEEMAAHIDGLTAAAAQPRLATQGAKDAPLSSTEAGALQPQPPMLSHTPTDGLSMAAERDLRERQASLTITMDADAILPDEIQPLPGQPLPGNHEWAAKHILLTGATGFVGAFVLDELVSRTDAHVYCLVRASGPDEAMGRLRDNLAHYGLAKHLDTTRITAIAGDLARPRLGVSEKQFADLGQTIDLIIHNGASVNLVMPYARLVAANVGGVKEMLRLAATGRSKPLHYVSTLAVVMGQNPCREQFIAPDDKNTPAGGYPRSKWVAEKILTAAAQRGFDVAIYRLGMVTGHSRSGISKTEDDYFHSMVKGCLQLARVPAIERPVAIVPVDFVSRALVHIATLHAPLGCNVYHLVNSNPAKSDEMLQWLGQRGYDVEVIPVQQWLQEVSGTLAADNALYRFKALLSQELHISDSRAITTGQGVVEHHNTDVALVASDIECPPVDLRLFNVYCDYLIQSRFLPPPTGAPSEGQARE